MAYEGPHPLPVKSGGTGDTSLTAYAVLCGGTTATGAIQSIAGVGSSGEILTSNGPGALPTFQTTGAASITINGDTGSVTGSSLTLTTGKSTQNCGSTVGFTGSSTTLTMNMADVSNNTIMGKGSGAASLNGAQVNVSFGQNNFQNFASSSAQNNSAFGYGVGTAITNGAQNTLMGTSSGAAITTGGNNTGFGYTTLTALIGGTNNIAIGFQAAKNYTNTESSNIIIGNTGTISESNVIRIGTQGGGSGQQNTCYVAGITGVTVSNTNYVTINTSTGQLGAVATIVNFTWTDVTGATQTIAASNGYLADRGGGVAFTLPASGTIGDTFRIVGVQGSWTLAQNANQQIKFGSAATTVGVTGSLASTNAGDCIECVATNTSASTVWRVMSSIGNITVV